MCFTIGGASDDRRTSEEIMVQMMKDDLGVEINPQAWRMFLRHRWERFAPLAHRIHGAHVRNARDEAIEAVRREKQREDLWKGKL